MMHRIRNAVFTRTVLWGTGAAALLLLIFGAFFAGQFFPKPEIKYLSSVSWTMPQYEHYLTELAKTKGALYAFDVLKNASFPQNVDTHLLGHEVGYVYYDQAGIAGLVNCVHDIGDACIHALVTEDFIHEGPDALEKMPAYCLTYAPNTLAYVNCFHGIGHGILAYLGYDFAKAVPECKTVFDYVRAHDPGAILRDVYGECVGGMTMEMLQGQHDPKAYAAMKPIYLPEKDPLSPCDASFVPAEVKQPCYQYLNSRFISLAGGTSQGDFPKDEVYRKALGYCASVADLSQRRTCYGGIGASFLYEVNDTDSRKFGTMSDDEIRQVHAWCALAEDADSVGACILTAGEILLGAGEHGTRAVARYCELVPDPEIKNHCYADVVGNARQYLSLVNLGTLCPRLPEPYRSVCYAPLN